MADFLNTQGGIALIIVAQCLAVVAFVMKPFVSSLRRP